jgi:hypothetical protein
MANFSDFQLGIYLGGLAGERPPFAMTHSGWADAARGAMSPELWDYVDGGAGDEAPRSGTCPFTSRAWTCRRRCSCAPSASSAS